VAAALAEGFARFEKAGVDAAALERAKTAREVGFYDGIGSVLGKAARLARYDLYAGTADFADTDVARLRAVTAADVRRVYEAYIRAGRSSRRASCPRARRSSPWRVRPRGRGGGGDRAGRRGGGGSERRGDVRAHAVRVRPDPGAAVRPEARRGAADGLERAVRERPEGVRDPVRGASRRQLRAGDRGRAAARRPREARRGEPRRPHAAARTARRTPAALEDTLRSLGADVSIAARDEHLVVSGRVLARHFERTLDLLEEILLEPRWDAEELALQKAAVVSQFQSEKVQATAIAARAFDVATFGEGHIYSRSRIGTPASVAALTMDDLRRFHAANLAPNVASFRVVGAVDRARAEAALQDLGTRWARRDVTVPAYGAPRRPSTSAVYFYDLPGAKQSVLDVRPPRAGARRRRTSTRPSR
jgi:zinc protease